MIVRAADFTADAEPIRRVRFSVFVDEQRVPADLEMDDRDLACRHVVAFDGATAVGTGRIDFEADGKIGRVAVLRDYRRRGVGAALMAELHEYARQQGLETVWCNAQITAAAFYERLGYRVTSERFYEAGIEHVEMVCDL